MISLSDHDKRILSSIGRGPYGKELIQIMGKIKAQLTSLDGIDTTRDYGDQVEGRLLFKEFAEDLIEKLSFERRQMRPLEPEEYE